jgi:prophage maintenance system killer protein
MAKSKSTSKHQVIREPLAARGGEIVFYQAPDGSVKLDVRLERDTIWLSLNQMAALFDRDKSVISRHLRNVFREGELDRESVVAFFATTAADGKTYQVEYYNLDAIISVGYRVNSKRGTQFRIWATQVLRDHILRGYTVNERRLRELQQTIRLVSTLADRRALSGEEATGLLRVVHDYSVALKLLDDYDHGRILPVRGDRETAEPISLEEAWRVIGELKERYSAGELFGVEQGNRLGGILVGVFQTVGGADVYPTIADKAAHLLYFLVKDHPFVDGKKRIGATLFLRFLEKNGLLYRSDGSRLLSKEELVALTLLLAESSPKDKESLVRLTTYLLSSKHDEVVRNV